ncbi:alpha/beta fold hydrolase [Sphingorhabdus buctiana]|uniref:Alpha/beta fold hydrolase n=1 Tax=Sphingorhabdus buctiana TaxID=1508805 RepID=A0ABW4MBL3_9SPHN
MRKFFKWRAIVLLVLIAALLGWGYAPDIPAKELRAKYANAESEFVDLGDGLTVHLRDEGPKDAPALILLHGSNASLHTWQQWVDRLGKDYRIIRYDQPGHGLTGPHPKDDYTAAGFVDVVDRVAKNRGLTQFYLGGNSMGGWVTHEYAKAHPEKLLGIILVDAAGAPDSRPKSTPIGFRIARLPGVNRLAQIVTPRGMIETSLKQSVSNQAIVTDAEVDEYWELLRHPGNREATGKRFALYGSRNTASPVPEPTRKLPALIIWGEEDKLIPVSAAKWFASTYSGSTSQIYKGIGHIPMEESPDRSAADVRAWLVSQQAAPAN